MACCRISSASVISGPGLMRPAAEAKTPVRTKSASDMRPAAAIALTVPAAIVGCEVLHAEAEHGEQARKQQDAAAADLGRQPDFGNQPV